MALDPIKRVRNFLTENFNAQAAQIVEQHAAAAAMSSVTALIPGAGPTACVLAQTALVYTMYVRLNNALGFRFSKNIMKGVASAVVGNIAANAATYILGVVGASLLSLIPGVGSAASAVLMAALGYAAVMIAAICYANTLLKLTLTHANVSGMTESDLKAAMQSELNRMDISQEMKAFADAYKKGRRKGDFTGREKVILES